MSHIARTFLPLLIATSFACGPSLEKGSKKKATNNSATNNVTNPNSSTNNGATNNGSSNNVAPNGATNSTSGGQACVGLEAASLNFGSVAVGSTAVAEVVLTNCSSTVPLTVDVLTTTDGFDAEFSTPLTIPANSSSPVEVTFTPTAEDEYAGTATFQTNAGPAVASLAGMGVVANGDCPNAVARGRVDATNAWSNSVQAMAGTTIMLAGAQSFPSEDIVSYEWSLLSRPANSSALLVPGATDVEPSLFLDMAGNYAVELRVASADSPEDCPTSIVNVTANASMDPNALVISMVWDTPGDADQTDAFGTDMDLHYKLDSGTWNAAPYDCFWQNPDADWGSDGMVAVDIDDTDGQGPEQITHSNPAADGTYSIGAYYYSDGQVGTSNVTIRVHQTGVLLLDKDKAGLSQGQFWYMGDYVMSLASLFVNDGVTTGFP